MACTPLPPWSPTAASHQGRTLTGGSLPTRNGVCSLLVTAVLGEERKCGKYNTTLQFRKATVSSRSKVGLSLLKRLQDLPELSFSRRVGAFCLLDFYSWLWEGLEPLGSACCQQCCKSSVTCWWAMLKPSSLVLHLQF